MEQYGEMPGLGVAERDYFYSADAIPEVLAAAYDLTRELLLAALAELAQEMESDPEEMDS